MRRATLIALVALAALAALVASVAPAQAAVRGGTTVDPLDAQDTTPSLDPRPVTPDLTRVTVAYDEAGSVAVSAEFASAESFTPRLELQLACTDEPVFTARISRERNLRDMQGGWTDAGVGELAGIAGKVFSETHAVEGEGLRAVRRLDEREFAMAPLVCSRFDLQWRSVVAAIGRAMGVSAAHPEVAHLLVPQRQEGRLAAQALNLEGMRHLVPEDPARDASGEVCGEPDVVHAVLKPDVAPVAQFVAADENSHGMLEAEHPSAPRDDDVGLSGGAAGQTARATRRPP